MRVFLSAADASGDLHAAELLRALRRRAPDLEAFGLGGAALEEAGLQPLVRQRELAVAGLVEILSSLPAILLRYGRLRSRLTGEGVDLVVLVDSPDLNLPLASVAKRRGVPVLYYIVPQVWAWRRGRLRKLRRRVDHAAVIFPFEEALLREAGIEASYVGHPLVERMAAFRRGFRAEEFAARVGLDLSRPVLGLFPGSRRNELRWNLPILLEAASIARDALPSLQPLLALAPSLRDLEPQVPAWVRVVRDAPHESMAVSTCLLTAAGTAAIEATLLGVPFAVVHRIHGVSFGAVRRMVRVPSACMTNLVADAGVVPERIQEHARPSVVAGIVLGLLRDPQARGTLQRRLEETAARLGGPGASDRAAEIALKLAGVREPR